MTYHYYHSPRTRIVHLTRNSRYTLCGWSIRAGWTEATGTWSNICYDCKRIRAADLAVAGPTLAVPDAQEATTP